MWAAAARRARPLQGAFRFALSVCFRSRLDPLLYMPCSLVPLADVTCLLLSELALESGVDFVPHVHTVSRPISSRYIVPEKEKHSNFTGTRQRRGVHIFPSTMVRLWGPADDDDNDDSNSNGEGVNACCLVLVPVVRAGERGHGSASRVSTSAGLKVCIVLLSSSARG